MLTVNVGSYFLETHTQPHTLALGITLKPDESTGALANILGWEKHMEKRCLVIKLILYFNIHEGNSTFQNILIYLHSFHLLHLYSALRILPFL